MSRALPHHEAVTPRTSRQGEKKSVPETPKQRRAALEGLALAHRLQAAADQHDAGERGEDVTDLSSEDFIARLRR